MSSAPNSNPQSNNCFEPDTAPVTPASTPPHTRPELCACTPDFFCNACIWKVDWLIEKGYFWNMRLDLIPVQYGDGTEVENPIWGLTRNKFVGLQIPPRESLLTTRGETVLYSSSINQILAWRGVGKTNFALALAGALATGGQILDFKANRPLRTLYLDGELPDAQLQERARMLTAPTDNLVLISADQTGPLNLRKEEHWEQLKIAIAAHGAQVVFLDSLSTLFRQEMNEEKEQLVLQERLQELRAMKLCVVTLHHLGKAGLQRGHSRNDDILDLQIQLNQPRGWEPGDGLCFELEYKKVRHGARLPQGFVVSLRDGRWIQDAAETEGQIQSMLEAGKSVRAIAAALDIPKSTVHRTQKRLGLAKLNASAGQ
jgi:hypothetical protein